jgi:hypothetical protein
MGRLHLFELGDQSWLPNALRNGMSEYLETVSRVVGAHRALAPLFDEVLHRSGERRVIDLCSGSGGPWVSMRELLKQPPDVTLTDKFPNQDRFDELAETGVTPYPQAVDATEVPDELRGVRTIINALHHFRPDEARAILADAAKQGAPLVVVELVDRNWLNIVSSPLILPMVYLLTPSVRPRRVSSWLLTYLVPVLPVTIFWDGLVSHLRAYSADELRDLTQSIAAPGYTWEHRRLPLGPGAAITVLIGMPPR